MGWSSTQTDTQFPQHLEGLERRRRERKGGREGAGKRERKGGKEGVGKRGRKRGGRRKGGREGLAQC